MFYVTTPSGYTRNCKTHKDAAVAARCSVSHIGKIQKSGKSSTTLRNGAIVTVINQNF